MTEVNGNTSDSDAKLNTLLATPFSIDDIFCHIYQYSNYSVDLTLDQRCSYWLRPAIEIPIGLAM